jgi:hypothetical protein
MAATSALALKSLPTASIIARTTERLRKALVSMILEGWERMETLRSVG